MSHETVAALWRAGGASVRGAAHARASSPNQDALRWLPVPGALICALSDGHGSARSFRSDLGALLAVQTALTVIPGMLAESTPSDPAALADQLPHAIVDAWRHAVECHLAAAPFTDDEWARLSAKDGGGARLSVEENQWLAYGATFLLCVVTPEFILYAQLGDGDILLVSQAGSVARPNWQADARLFANETTSLCMPDAWQEMRVDVQPIVIPDTELPNDSQPARSLKLRVRQWEGRGVLPPPVRTLPALIVLATDGYANSFEDESGFVQVGCDLLAMIRADGFDAVSAGLPAWLEETSRLGSGDDITVGFVYRTPAPADDVFPEPQPADLTIALAESGGARAPLDDNQ